MDLGNWLTPVIVLFVTFTLLTRFFTKLEETQEQLQKERLEKAALEERERIARELHDGMAQSLFLLSVKIKQLKNITVEQEDEKTLQQLEENVAHIHDYVRTGIKNLRLSVAENIQFTDAVGELLTTFSAELNCSFVQEVRIDEAVLSLQEKQELIYCIKEALTNIQKHARATKVEVIIHIDCEDKIITIKDNGRGFPDQLERANHYGLRMMQERCLRIQWEFKIFRRDSWIVIQFEQEGKGGP